MDKIFLMTRETFKKYVEVFPYSEHHKRNICSTFNSLLNFLGGSEDKAVVTISKDEFDEVINKYLETKASPTHKNLERSCLKCIFYLHNVQFNPTDYRIDQQKSYKDFSERFLTFNEFVLEINNFFNNSEKLLCYMAFKNILGEDLINPRMAKVSDVDLEQRVWKLPDGRLIECDDFLIGLLRGTLNQTEYIPYNKKNKVSPDGLYMPKSYKYNLDSEYLFKSRNHPRSGNGLVPFRKVGIEETFTRLAHEFGCMFNKNNLKISGFLHAMYEEDPTPTWTVERIREFKKVVGCKISHVNAREFYMYKYFPELPIRRKGVD